jgi:hypothetical protein
MKFMIMVFGERAELHSRSPEWIERLVGFMVRLEDELAQSGELVYSEVLEGAKSATLVDPRGAHRPGPSNASDAPLSRYWVVKVPDESRAIEIAASVAAVVERPVEVRQCMEQSLRP